MQTERNQSLKQEIINYAKNKLEIDLIGFTAASPDLQAKTYLENFISEKRSANLTYLENTTLRTTPTLLLPEAKTVISIAINYFREQPPLTPGSARVARYAYGRDYHRVIKKTLIKLGKFIQTISPSSKFRPCVDSAPIMEKSYAVKSGLGFIGKNTTLINREYGSFILLGELLTDLDLPHDKEKTGTCGSCTRCIEACPTSALVEPFKMNAELCISYQTIENKNPIPKKLQSKLRNYIFGCDICQEVCPYNKIAKPIQISAMKEVKIAGHELNLLEILKIKSDEQFQKKFVGSPLMRAKLSKLKSTAKILLKNQKQ